MVKRRLATLFMSCLFVALITIPAHGVVSFDGLYSDGFAWVRVTYDAKSKELSVWGDGFESSYYNFRTYFKDTIPGNTLAGRGESTFDLSDTPFDVTTNIYFTISHYIGYTVAYGTVEVINNEQPTEPTISLTFGEPSYTSKVGESITLSAAYVGRNSPSDIRWGCSDETSVTLTGDSSIQGSILGQWQNTFYISRPMVASRPGTYTVQVTVDGLSASTQLVVEEPEYTMQFSANGGSGTMSDVTTRDGRIVLPSCGFTPFTLCYVKGKRDEIYYIVEGTV